MRPSCPLPKLGRRHVLASESNCQALPWRVVQSHTSKNRKPQIGSRTCSSCVFQLREWISPFAKVPRAIPSPPRVPDLSPPPTNPTFTPPPAHYLLLPRHHPL